MHPRSRIYLCQTLLVTTAVRKTGKSWMHLTYPLTQRYDNGLLPVRSRREASKHCTPEMLNADSSFRCR